MTSKKFCKKLIFGAFERFCSKISLFRNVVLKTMKLTFRDLNSRSLSF